MLLIILARSSWDFSSCVLLFARVVRSCLCRRVCLARGWEGIFIERPAINTLLHRQDLTTRANNSTHEEKSQEDLARIISNIHTRTTHSATPVIIRNRRQSSTSSE